MATGLSHGTVQNYLTIARALPLEIQRGIVRFSHDPKDLTISKALILANSKLESHVIAEKVTLIKKKAPPSQL